MTNVTTNFDSLPESQTLTDSIGDSVFGSPLREVPNTESGQGANNRSIPDHDRRPVESATRMQKALISHLLHPESLAYIREELRPLDVILDNDLVKLLTWALDEFEASGRAPSGISMMETWRKFIERCDIEIGSEPEDSIQFVVGNLKARYVETEWQRRTDPIFKEISQAPASDYLSLIESVGHVSLDLVEDVGGQTRGLTAIPLSRIPMEQVEWLWEDYIPLGFVTVLNGLDKIGKSTLLYDCASKVTQGTLSGDLYGEPGSVLVSTTEDTMRSMFSPRMNAAGADPDLTYLLKKGDTISDLTLPDDVWELKRRIKRTGARLVIIDPIPAHMTGVLSPNSVQDVRKVITPLARVAEELNCAIVGVVHWNKGNGKTVRNRMSGSGAWSDAARSVLTCAENPHNPEEYVITARGNLVGKDGHAHTYRTEEAHVIGVDGKEIATSRVIWGEAIQITEGDLLGGNKDLARDTAKDVILATLGDEWKPWREIQPLLDDADVSYGTARIARTEFLERGLIEKKGATKTTMWRRKQE